MKRLNLIGERFGKLVVKGDAGATKHGHSQWHCKCDCGTELVVARTELRSGDTMSCGCGQYDGRNTTFAAGVEYRDVTGWPGYRVGADGSVWSAWQHVTRPSRYVICERWTQLNPTPSGKSGYLRVSLHKGGKKTLAQVHSIVAREFLGVKPIGLEVCHNNGNPADNRPSNLRYDTHKNNMSDRLAHGTSPIGERHPRARLTESDVRDIRTSHANGTNFHELAARYGLKYGSIYNIIRRQSWRHVA
jgi:hypothetical protein